MVSWPHTVAVIVTLEQKGTFLVDILLSDNCFYFAFFCTSWIRSTGDHLLCFLFSGPVTQVLTLGNKMFLYYMSFSKLSASAQYILLLLFLSFLLLSCWFVVCTRHSPFYEFIGAFSFANCRFPGKRSQIKIKHDSSTYSGGLNSVSCFLLCRLLLWARTKIRERKKKAFMHDAHWQQTSFYLTLSDSHLVMLGPADRQRFQ